MPKNRVREFREKLGLSQVALARQALCASPTLSDIERGKRLPWPKLKQVLALVLQTTPETLFPEEDPAANPAGSTVVSNTEGK
jgi:transcriptional regulator with XRE-family HTH domain